MGSKHLQLGEAGESAALDVYRRADLDLIARNWRCGIGELDLVLADGDTIVFCEVKTRRGSAFGGGYEAVDRTKQAKLRKLAELFLLGWSEPYSSVRFDVASVLLRTGDQPSVTLFEDAF